jgi:hypothetical protein
MDSTKNTPKNRNGVTRRMKTVIRKLHLLGKFRGVKVAVAIEKEGKTTTYQSIKSWWPTLAEMVGIIATNRAYN